MTDARTKLHKDMSQILDELSLGVLDDLEAKSRERPGPVGVDVADAAGTVWIGSLSGFEIAPAPGGEHVRLLHRCDWSMDVRPDALHDGATYIGNLIVEALRHRRAGCGLPHTNLCGICGNQHQRCMSATCPCEGDRPES